MSSSGDYAKPWHWHDCVMFMLPSQGAIELKHEGRSKGVWLSQECFAVVPSRRGHQTRAALASHRHIALYVTEDALRKVDARMGSLQEFYRRADRPILIQRSAALRALQDLAIRKDLGAYGGSALRLDIASALLVQCISDVMTGMATPDAARHDHGAALVADLKSYIVNHADRNLPLDEMGQRFGISRRHLTRLFREKSGVSIGAYQQGARLKQAKTLLTGTDLSIGEIALRVGFESGGALARTMRRTTGRSPSEIRTPKAR
ncbi:helix-turn-helix domain-containing protein [Acetobacter nitrogenifigens]